jgi:hypothetical protein
LETRIAFDRPVVESDGSLTPQSRLYFKTLTDYAVIIGTGSPEGVVDAPQGSVYMDDAGTAGAIDYRKRDSDIGGDTTQGWILV